MGLIGGHTAWAYRWIVEEPPGEKALNKPYAYGFGMPK